MNWVLKEQLLDLHYDQQQTSAIEILRLIKSSTCTYDKIAYQEVWDYFYTDKKEKKNLSEIVFRITDLIESVR